MCYAMLLFNKRGIGEEGFEIVKKTIEENRAMNRDGYAILFKDYSTIDRKFRTLDYEKYMEFVEKNQEEIEMSKMVHLHLRFSTGCYANDYVHLWEFSGWECSHNGVVMRFKSRGCDSYEFYKENADHIGIPLVFAEDLVRSGAYGVFFATAVEKPKVVVGSVGKPCWVGYKDGLYIFASERPEIDFLSEQFRLLCKIPVYKTEFYEGEMLDVVFRIDFDKNEAVEVKLGQDLYSRLKDNMVRHYDVA